MQASEGVGPNGEVEYRYRRNYGAAFVHDDIKVASRLAVNAGMRWEYIGPSVDEAGTIGNVSLAALRETAIPPAGGTLVGNTVAANYNPELVNPYTGMPFGAPPAGVAVRASKSFYENGAPLAKFAPRMGFHGSRSDRADVWCSARPTAGLPESAIQRECLRRTVVHLGPFRAGLHQCRFEQQPFHLREAVSHDHPRVRTPHPDSQLSDRAAGPEFRIPRLQQWNVTAKVRLFGNMSPDLGYVGSHGGQLLLSRGRNQPLLATGSLPVNCGYDGVPSDCVVTNTAANAAQRVPVLGETPTALVASEFTGTSWYKACRPRCAGRRRRVWHFRWRIRSRNRKTT